MCENIGLHFERLFPHDTFATRSISVIYGSKLFHRHYERPALGFFITPDRQPPRDAQTFGTYKRLRQAVEGGTSFEKNLDIGICPAEDNVLVMA